MSHCSSQFPHSLRCAHGNSGSGISTHVSAGGSVVIGVSFDVAGASSPVLSAGSEVEPWLPTLSRSAVEGDTGAGVGAVGEPLVVDDAGAVGEMEALVTGVTGAALVVWEPVSGKVSMSAELPWLEQAKPKVARETEKTIFRMKDSSG